MTQMLNCQRNIEPLKTNDTMSDENKKHLLKYYTSLKESEMNTYNNIKDIIEGITKAYYNNITNGDGMYCYNCNYVRKDYYNQFIEKQNSYLKKCEKRLERYIKIIEDLQH